MTELNKNEHHPACAVNWPGNKFCNCHMARSAFEKSHAELLVRLEVANDWLADKGVPANHVEMKRIREAIANAKTVRP